ncbi:MAG: 2-amino-4-hydroxy-6-hydroxymethyldihydropteridine diphosphokinase [Gammaproteobacteria bacterium]|nr:2-amino-4-hydroxy-6-hydroxymethyldihydropteridine diphosphokinase [Gammaproteobacteria bacterium]NIR88855.1 2-amino-4-hydroxy-6-hydroxymethyldihydropteridine diphosphokinase [Gammaproteobacteria bacterium]NIU06459.1 2-amino-4-hydroxy-6-hydroxymethyldihydropteridine diphosphokinase [Gammaproteobacteria bacterium]NIV53351.1 2-amino-4-hydroxy-6-hydroxymethyldihydropteridine diphosphokinase [Gammaproteobacteria bacterium]NIV74070.1 2-amino-4-hydroxy-6-hydroxymethyldihydropteridine diphosphokinas
MALGSNIQAPVAQLRRARRALDALPGTRLVKCSALYRSPPLGRPDQPDYVNAVACLRTQLSAGELLGALQGIERAQGRVRDGARWGARTLDLDLLLYGDARIEEPHLTVPHPRMHERAFVLYPLHEIAPHVRVPGRGALVALLERVPAHGLRILALA